MISTKKRPTMSERCEQCEHCGDSGRGYTACAKCVVYRSGGRWEAFEVAGDGADLSRRTLLVCELANFAHLLRKKIAYTGSVCPYMGNLLVEHKWLEPEQLTPDLVVQLTHRVSDDATKLAWRWECAGECLRSSVLGRAPGVCEVALNGGAQPRPSDCWIYLAAAMSAVTVSCAHVLAKSGDCGLSLLLMVGAAAVGDKNLAGEIYDSIGPNRILALAARDVATMLALRHQSAKLKDRCREVAALATEWLSTSSNWPGLGTDYDFEPPVAFGLVVNWLREVELQAYRRPTCERNEQSLALADWSDLFAWGSESSPVALLMSLEAELRHVQSLLLESH